MSEDSTPMYIIIRIEEQLPQEVLVTPIVSTYDIEDAESGIVLPPATEHLIKGPGRVTFYRGEDPTPWLAEHGYKKVLDSDICRSSEVDGWYSLSNEE